jgi:putative hydrolase of the HAD superfamily
MYLMVIYLLSNEAVTLQEVDTTSLYTRMECLVLENLPELYDSTTPQLLYEIKSRQAVTISLLSNTAFIKGCTLRKVLRELGLQQYFDFEIYSDEVGMSKPNIKIFELMLKNVQSLRNETLAPGEILHIGDNEIADIAAATKMGIAAYQVNSNHQLITDLLH